MIKIHTLPNLKFFFLSKYCMYCSITILTFICVSALEDLKRIHTQAIISCSPNIYDDSNFINYLWSWMKRYVSCYMASM